MPWEIRESEGKYCVHKEGEDDPLKCYDNKAEATDYLQALYASEEKSVKVGGRHSSKDHAHLRNAIQEILDAGGSHERIGDMPQAEIPIIDPEKSAVTFGGTVKAIKLDDGGVKFSGPLVTFSDENTPDLTGDFFTKDTDYGDAESCDVYFNHCMPIEYGGQRFEYKQRLGKAKLTRTDAAIFAEAILYARNEYEKAIIEAGMAGKLGWSSGTANHLVEREHTGKSYHIQSWILGLDASLTPTPAEPRNSVIPLKSLMSDNTATKPTEGNPEAVKTAGSEDGKGNAETYQSIPQGAEQMDITPETLQQYLKDAAAEAVKSYRDSEPPLKTAAANLTVTKAEGDQPWRSNGEFFTAVKHAAYRPMDTDQRLLAVKAATGMNEAVPSQGGFLAIPEVSKTIIDTMYAPGSLLGYMRVENVSSNRMVYPAVNETSRANGSRYGGITGYWLGEAGSITTSKPAFNQLDVPVNKIAALCVATDELLEDASALQSWLMGAVPNELRFRVEDAIINGDGVAKPLGILTDTTALTSATRTDASEIDSLDVGRMWAGRIAGYNDYIWTVNQNCFPQLMSMTVGQQPVFLPAGGLSGLPYGTLFGRPVIETEYNPALGTAGDILLFSPSAYKLIQNGGINAQQSIHLYFSTAESAFRFIYRVGGQPVYRTQITGFDSGSYSPYVVLSASS